MFVTLYNFEKKNQAIREINVSQKFHVITEGKLFYPDFICHCQVFWSWGYLMPRVAVNCAFDLLPWTLINFVENKAITLLFFY